MIIYNFELFDYVDQWTEDEFNYLTGVQKTIFCYIWKKYGNYSTPLSHPCCLYLLLNYYRFYPMAKEHRLIYGVQQRDVIRWENYLATVIEELQDAWNNRVSPENALPYIFPINVTGSIDTFPIYIRRPKHSGFQSAMYNGGKYRKHIVKVQCIVNHAGTIIWYSGPHLGTSADINLWRIYKPVNELYSNELLIGDKAYVGSKDILTEFKEYKYEEKTKKQKAWNRCIQWYRSSVEHAFAYLKRFHILSGRFRGMISKSSLRLAKALKILIHICTIYCRNHQMRYHY